MTDREKLEAIERDRKRREAILLLALLALLGDARAYIIYSIRDNGTVPPLNLPRLRQTLTRAMADAHVSGYRRAGVLSDVPLVPIGVAVEDLPEYQQGLATYRPAANDIADKLIVSVTGLAQTAVQEARQQQASPARAVADAFTRYGFSPRDPASIDPAATGRPGFAAMGVATDAVLQAYAGGLWAGYHAPGMGHLTGFRHRSVIDIRTSKYCDENSGREGLTLPKEDPYWLENFCPLHRSCRSTVLPVFGAAKWSDYYPEIPPQPGYGKAPAYVFGYRLAG